MPVWLLTVWPWIKKLGPWVIGAMLILFAVLHFEGVGERRQKAKDDAIIAGDQIAMQRGIDAINVLRGALNDQNAHVEALATEGEERAREAAQARDAALKANASLVATESKLSQVAKRTYSSAEPCATPAEVMGAKL